MVARAGFLLALVPALASAQYSATYWPGQIPAQTEQGQYGTNQCDTSTAGPNSRCQTVMCDSRSLIVLRMQLQFDQ